MVEERLEMRLNIEEKLREMNLTLREHIAVAKILTLILDEGHKQTAIELNQDYISKQMINDFWSDWNDGAEHKKCMCIEKMHLDFNRRLREFRDSYKR